MNWISIKDKLPEPFELVLVFGHGYYDILQLNQKKFSFTLIGLDNGVNIPITHWMPLPKSPEGK